MTNCLQKVVSRFVLKMAYDIPHLKLGGAIGERFSIWRFAISIGKMSKPPTNVRHRATDHRYEIMELDVMRGYISGDSPS